MESTSDINFHCQRCHQPIHLDNGFYNLNEHNLAELSLPLFHGSGSDTDGGSLEGIIPRLRLYDSSGHNHGFTLVGEASQHDKAQPIKILTRLFDHMSSNSGIDHPLCEECTDTLLEVMDENLALTEKQVSMYSVVVDSLYDMPDSETKALELELKSLENEEERLLLELEEVEKQHAEAEKVLEKNKEEKARLEEEECIYWHEYCSFRKHLTVVEEEQRRIKNERNYMEHQLNRLIHINAFNSTFKLWPSGCFGTINNLRLGKLRTSPVTWPEINTAWGQLVLLLAALARKAGYTFSKYKLIPYGNMSYIETLSDGKVLPLYGSGGLRILWDNKFDAGMVAFLDCAAEFGKFIDSKGCGDPKKKFVLPYPIHKHFLEDVNKNQFFSIKMQFNSEEEWTKALKFLLTNIKWSITWAAKEYGYIDNERLKQLLAQT